MPPRADLRPGALAALVLLGALLVLARFHTYHEPFETDITAASVIAHEMLEGRALYADIWDHKPPALALTHMAAIALAGWGPGAIFLLNLAASLATLGGVYAAGAAIGPASAGLWAATFWTVLSGDLWLQGNQPNAEAFINACLVWAFALLVRTQGASGGGRFVAIGALVAWASLYKQVALVPALLVVLVHIAWPPAGRSRVRAAADAALAGGVVVLAWGATLAYFTAVGRLAAFWDAVVVYNRHYAAGAGGPLGHLLLAFQPAQLFSTWLRSTPPLAVLVALGMLLGLPGAHRRQWSLFAALALATPIAIGLPGAFAPHYYQLWLPPLVVGGGWATHALARVLRGRPAWLPHAAAGGALVLLIAYQAPLYLFPPDDWSLIKYGPIFVEERQLARELDTLLLPGETFYLWGSELGLYFWTRRPPVCGPCFVWPVSTGPLALSLTDRVLRDLARKPPELFIVANWTWQWLKIRHPVIDWGVANYRPMPGGHQRGPFSLYVRRGGTLEERAERAARK